MEVWKEIINYEDYYEISNLGNVRSIDREFINKRGALRIYKGKILKPKKVYVHEIPRYVVNLSKDSVVKTFIIARLVATAFIPNPNNLPQVNHKDENPLNNCVENLEWCTASYNVNYGTRNLRAAKKISKKINMYSINKEYICNFSSIKEAAKYIHGNSSCIIKVCQGIYAQYYGYIFEYA